AAGQTAGRDQVIEPSLDSFVRPVFDSTGPKILQKSEQALAPGLREGVRKEKRDVVPARAALDPFSVDGDLKSVRGTIIFLVPSQSANDVIRGAENGGTLGAQRQLVAWQHLHVVKGRARFGNHRCGVEIAPSIAESIELEKPHGSP